MDEFVSLTGANIISCENIESVSEIFRRYFSCQPPFSASGKKKEEFPDAFAMFGIICWARTHDAKVLVVSADPDWKAFFDDNPNFEVMDDLSQAIAVFQPANVALSLRSLVANCLPHGRSDKIYRFIWNSIETYLDGLYLHPDADSQFYFEADLARIILENLSFPDLDSESITIIEYNKSSVVLEIDVLIAYSCECDFSFSVYDSVDKEHIGMGSSVESQKDEVFFQLLLTFEGDFLKSENDYDIVGCEVVFFPDSFHFGLVEPDCVDLMQNINHQTSNLIAKADREALPKRVCKMAMNAFTAGTRVIINKNNSRGNKCLITVKIFQQLLAL